METTFMWVTPGRIINRIDDYRGRITCDACGVSDEFERADGALMSAASLGNAGANWDHVCGESSDEV